MMMQSGPLKLIAGRMADAIIEANQGESFDEGEAEAENKEASETAEAAEEVKEAEE